MNTILVPLDGSALAEQTLPVVRSLAPLLDAEVQLLRVITDADYTRQRAHYEVELRPPVAIQLGQADLRPPVTVQLGLAEREQKVWDILRQQAESYLNLRAQTLREAGLHVTTMVEIGTPAECIIAVAAHQPTALIVMATHGYSGLRRWALGSVTDKVLQAAPVSVVVVREAPGELKVRRVLVPLDGSALAQQALPMAVRLARSAHAELLLLQAVETPGDPYSDAQRFEPPPLDTLRDQAMQTLVAAAATLPPEVRATTSVAFGYAPEVIVDTAAQRQADLVVMATHGYSGLRRWALGSVADKVLHATRIPLLLVRAQADTTAIG